MTSHAKCLGCAGETVSCEICPTCHRKERDELTRLKSLSTIHIDIIMATSVLTAQSLFAIAAAKHGEQWGSIALGDLASGAKNLEALLARRESMLGGDTPSTTQK